MNRYRNLNDLLNELPNIFTARQAHAKWGYKRIKNTHAMIRALEESGLIYVVSFGTKIQGGSCGQRGQYMTWRKVHVDKTED